MGHVSWKSAFEHVLNVDLDHPAHAQSIIWAFIHSVLSNESVSGQWRPWSVCTDVQADLGFCCPHMPEDGFLHGAAYMY